ncbi:MAG TPA: acyl transferase, partial [Chryseobacterium sp.]|nr:acyl transferase [Chryseobacterium sp.]
MKQNIFDIKTEEDFRTACLETFRYQYENLKVYRKFVDYLNINPSSINQVSDIPFLPIEMFKNHLVLDKNTEAENYFQSSGTTQMNRSKHYIADFSLYEESIYKSFEQFIGKPEDYIFLGLLPNYSENPHSSLIYMIDFLIKKSNKPENGYFLYNHQELFNLLQTLSDKKVILFGVSFALLDFLDYCHANSQTLQFSQTLTVIETGGMKGRKEEMTKDELLKIFQNGFKTDKIYSEYSMTELLSQAYSLGENIYKSPNWMKILVRNTEDPFSYVEEGRTGAINIIDLANRHSC